MVNPLRKQPPLSTVTELLEMTQLTCEVLHVTFLYSVSCHVRSVGQCCWSSTTLRGSMALIAADRPAITNPQIFNSLLSSPKSLVLWALMLLCAHGRPSYTIVCVYICAIQCHAVVTRSIFLPDIHKRHHTPCLVLSCVVICRPPTEVILQMRGGAMLA